MQEALRRGWHVIALAPDFDSGTIYQLEKMGVECVSYRLQRTGMNVYQDLRSVFELVHIFRYKTPTIVLNYTIKPVLYGSIAAWLAGVKNIFSMITGLGFSFSGTGVKQKMVAIIASTLFKLALRKNKKVFFQNPDDLNFFKERRFVRENNAVIINGSGVDVDHFYSSPLPQKPRFLMIARLLKEKGVYEYVEAVKRVKVIYPDIQFDLAGWIDNAPSAIREEELTAWVEQGHVNYLGKLSDIRPAIKKISIYVLPSYREGTPRTVLEAMAMGRAILTTDVPGCRETVQEGVNGCLIKVRSATELADKMLYLLRHTNEVVRMGKNSRKIAVDKYDVHSVNKKILNTLGVAAV